MFGRSRFAMAHVKPIMSNEITISCGVCGGHIAFPVEDMGRAAACPHCASQIILTSTADGPDRWTYFVGGKPYGPCSTEQISKLLISKAISSSIIVTREGGQEHLRISAIPEFAEFLPKSMGAKLDVIKRIKIMVNKASALGKLHKRIVAGGCVAILMMGIAGWYFGVQPPNAKKAEQTRQATIAQQQNVEKVEAKRIKAQGIDLIALTIDGIPIKDLTVDKVTDLYGRPSKTIGGSICYSQMGLEFIFDSDGSHCNGINIYISGGLDEHSSEEYASYSGDFMATKAEHLVKT